MDLAKSVAKVDFAYRVEAELMAMYDELRASVGPVDTDIEPVEPDLRRTVYRLVTIHSMAYSAFHASVLPEDSWNAIDAECSYWLHRDLASHAWRSAFAAYSDTWPNGYARHVEAALESGA